jgi:hypothetical protein
VPRDLVGPRLPAKGIGGRLDGIKAVAKPRQTG